MEKIFKYCKKLVDKIEQLLLKLMGWKK